MAFNGGSSSASGGSEPHNKRLCTRNSTDNTATEAGHANNKTIIGNNTADEPRRKRHDLARPNHILLFTVINPLYPITVEVLHTISHPYGQVQRIVIFKKNGVQAMVEFDSIESATRARDNLNGADIYSGCCTLKIDYAKPEKLNVYKNDSDTSWDFTLTEPPLLGPGSTGFPGYGPPDFHQATESWKQPPAHAGIIKETPGMGPATRNPSVNFVSQGQQQGAVMMVYGLDGQTSNTEKLFNLVCLYGNVARIKFLKTKEGTAMVQMGDSVAVERCVQHLNNIPVGNNGKLQIAFSKQNFLSEVTNPFSLPDHTPSFKEFTGSKNNRFLSPTQASKNRIQPPSKILHFFNTPPGLTEEQLIGIFNIKEVPPTAVRMFPLKTERSSSGLIEFSSVAQAVLAIMKCNHIPIESKGTKFPFIMKLCFSSSKSMNGTWSAENNGEKMNGEN
ncbi:heterogeneous nuclear ribonucleoprotein L isoform X3 [Phlebotomus argentipes]|uniref:heterogeneous nuclear ribonucleoprotein L isoform X3 n=1 Tax=Phlebotomus argentipes TaxID=94469 RepID=UPI0028932580|nr:heterogeneous nuclear ribonucleoprotein L isoform X3 [Phlebotomus argentipes]